MPIESYTVIDGTRVNDPAPGDAPPTDSAAAGTETGVPGATDPSQAGTGQPSASPTETPPVPGGEPGTDTDDDEPLRDDTEITAARLERRFKRLTAARRQAERERDALAQQHQVELAQTRGQLEMVQRLLAGAAPALPETPAQPTGPPSAEQYTSHEDYVLAAARYGAQQELQARDQQTQEQRQQAAADARRQRLAALEAPLKAQHPDFDRVVSPLLQPQALAPHVQQFLFWHDSGPAVAYALGTIPGLREQLNQLPPPLALVALGELSARLAPPPASAEAPNGQAPAAPAPGATGTTPPPALPAPPTPLSGAGAGAPTGGYREDMSQEEYRQWRKRTSQLPVWKQS